MTKIVNLTPHEIVLNGQPFPPSGKVVRVEETTETIGSITISSEENPNVKTTVVIPLIHKKLGRIIDLPEPQDETFFVVSLVVAQAAKRPDVLAIGESIRNEKGQIIGAKSLAVV